LKSAITILCMFILLSVGLGQQTKPRPVAIRPDFSGKWSLELSKSSPKGNPLYDELTLTILHREPEIIVVRQLKKKQRETSQRLIYYTDKRGEMNPSLDGRENLRSKTHWDDSTLVSTSSVSKDMPLGYIIDETTERWELAPDGDTLKQIRLFKVTFVVNGSLNPGSTQKTIRVFKRVS
jgi:hypothetical protein